VSLATPSRGRLVERPRHRDLDPGELEAYVRRLAARPDLWAHLVAHDPARRIYEELLRDDHLAVWLICWMDEHDTGYHDHDLSAGAVAVTAGTLCEERLALGGAPVTRTVSAGGSFTFTAADIHRVNHAGDGPAVSLHAYSPPLRRMGAYEVGAGGALRRHAVSYEEELRPLSAAV
jgi:predicted metal-dependent enzyme (double-stranded beta helix superfamily)